MRGLVKPLIPLNAAKVRKNGDSTKIFVPFLVFFDDFSRKYLSFFA